MNHMSDLPESGSSSPVPPSPPPAAGATPPPYVPSAATPPPYVPPAGSAAPTAPTPAGGGAKLGGLAIAALIVGGIAFLSGWVPFFGALLGLTGVGLGIFALLRRQSKVVSIISIGLSGLALLTSAGLTIAVIVAAATGGTAAPSTTLEPAPPTAEASATEPTEEPTEAPPATDIDAAAFASEAHGHIADINKDLDDMVERTVNEQMFRLLGNTVELSFNLAQLRVLETPEAVAADWTPALNNLEAAIQVASDAASDYSAGTISAEAMLVAIEATRTQAAAVDAIVSQVG